MIKSLAGRLKSMFAAALRTKSAPTEVPPPGVADDTTSIYKELAMTEELREALFPKTPQMVSAIFDRPLPPLTRPPETPPPPAASDEGSFPIIF